MNSLKQLRAGARDRLGRYLESGTWEEIDDLIAHTYETAIKDCLEALPKDPQFVGRDATQKITPFMEGMEEGGKYYRIEAEKSIQALLPNNT